MGLLYNAPGFFFCGVFGRHWKADGGVVGWRLKGDLNWICVSVDGFV